MLKIRLQRVGRKHEPTFRVVLTDKRNSTKSGRFLEVLGHHDPRGERMGEFKKERIAELVSHGAQPTATVHNLLIKRGIIKGEKIDVSAKKKKGKGEAEAKAVASTPEAVGAPTSNTGKDQSVGKEKSESVAEEPKAEAAESKEKEVEAKAAPKANSETPKSSKEDVAKEKEPEVKADVSKEEKTAEAPKAEAETPKAESKTLKETPKESPAPDETSKT